MSKHKKHTDADLVDALEHIVYEIWKYRQSVAQYGEIQRVGGDAALEFRVLHHRVLLEFFYGPAKHANNILAWEYIHNWQQMHVPTNVPWLENYLSRCHTMLAHISTTRSQMAKCGLKGWGGEWQTVEPHLNRVITEFLTSLAADHKATCLGWINEWLLNCGLWSAVLSDLVPLVSSGPQVTTAGT